MESRLVRRITICLGTCQKALSAERKEGKTFLVIESKDLKEDPLKGSGHFLKFPLVALPKMIKAIEDYLAKGNKFEEVSTKDFVLTTYEEDVKPSGRTESFLHLSLPANSPIVSLLNLPHDDIPEIVAAFKKFKKTLQPQTITLTWQPAP